MFLIITEIYLLLFRTHVKLMMGTNKICYIILPTQYKVRISFIISHEKHADKSL